MTALILNSNLDNNLYLSSSSSGGSSITTTTTPTSVSASNAVEQENGISSLFPMLAKGEEKMSVSIADTTAEEMKKSSFASLVPSNIEFVRFAIKHKSYS
ncbi:hypothetical protein CYY_007809 [Polysphondylium violaceum]|uniref:Uncharacterized protein n=1 Tax=Polysphondylium violaceum TaxID=133409 RepID=A0A8J4UXT4_9MYCE|nr:hypothetical protein CYY_007809 [Polysphondylium violaceum]